MGKFYSGKVVPSTASATEEASGYPATNAILEAILRPWKSTTTGAQDVVITLPASSAVAGVMLQDTNCIDTTGLTTFSDIVTGGALGTGGMRTVKNLATTLDISAFSITRTAAITTGVRDPFGGNNAFTVTASAANAYVADPISASLSVGSVARNTMYIRRRTGAGALNMYDGGSGTSTAVDSVVTSDWKRIDTGAVPVVAASANYQGIFIFVSGDAVDLYWPQAEDVAAKTNKNPSELSPVGTTYYNCLNPNTVSGNVVTETVGTLIQNSSWARLPGAAGSNFSTPDAASNRFAGDVDFRFFAALPSWTTGVVPLLQKNASGTGYELYLSSGNICFSSYVGGSASISTSTALVSFAAAASGWVRVTRAALTGAVEFYTSTDGLIWTQLGTTVTGPAGAQGTNASNLVIGQSSSAVVYAYRIFRVQLYAGINAISPAVDFDPSTFAAGASTGVASTSETWTLNGTCTITLKRQAALIPPTIDFSVDGTTYSQPMMLAPKLDNKIANRRRALVAPGLGSIKKIRIRIPSGTPSDSAAAWRLGALYVWSTATTFPQMPTYGVKVSKERPLVSTKLANGRQAVAVTGAAYNVIEAPFDRQIVNSFNALIAASEGSTAGIDFEVSTMPELLWPVRSFETTTDETLDRPTLSKITLKLTESV